MPRQSLREAFIEQLACSEFIPYILIQRACTYYLHGFYFIMSYYINLPSKAVNAARAQCIQVYFLAVMRRVAQVNFYSF